MHYGARLIRRFGNRPRTYGIALVAAVLPAISSAASLNIYLSNPGSQSTYISGATTENFNTLPLGIKSTPYASAIGTYQFSSTSHFAVLAADQYGGANGSDYVSVGVQSQSSTPVDLDLSRAANYFGFWWSAGDPNNGISFYYNTTLLTRITTATIVSLLSAHNGSVTAVNGSTYSKSSYYGNPNNGRDAGEPFAYVDVFAGGTEFNRIVFDNSGTSGSGFESDNHSVYFGSAGPNGASVFVENVPAVAVTGAEPASIVLSLLGLIGLAALGYKKLLPITT